MSYLQVDDIACPDTKECCAKCNSLKTLWWFESDGKKYGHCCVMLLMAGDNTVLKIDEPENDMCEMFEEVEE
jgi:hypothetical protein